MSDVVGLVTAGVAVVVAIGGYVQFVLRRSIFPCIGFDVHLDRLGHSVADQAIAEMVLSIQNAGPGIGFVANVQGRVLFRLVGETGVGSDDLEPGFAHALTARPGHPASSGIRPTGATTGRDQEPIAGRAEEMEKQQQVSRILGSAPFFLAPGDRNFIQPGVTQWYRKPLALPADARLIAVWGAFEYHIEVGRVTWALARFLSPRPPARTVTYTVRRTFALGEAE